ncbi:PDZ domain-containing protein [Ktedonosporobacter rubrisoli]|uniref:PDZ domain-containing protein n=1 Tax=Ktedonosporobacter rubrisoli TaxID=2509675 RepID=A0A4P6JSB7_KTERU|nr:M50 family metallopeptidase [Ktedonosporobacter rubrisoli]QBD78409.1 PDZ domain-containing protein [Ktedonosporobacter rubrisoli]
MNNWFLLAAIPVFGLLVLVHEFGHFITAKWAGIRVEEFGLGFPPTLISFRRQENGRWEVFWFGRGRDSDGGGSIQTPLNGTSGGISRAAAGEPDRTIYSINLLPIGGFVRMPGENGDALDEEGHYDPRSFAAKSAGRRMIVLVAGVTMNVILAMVLFTIAYGLGEPNYVSAPVLGTVVPGSPAALAGLRTNDTIISVDGKPVHLFTDLVNVVNKIAAENRDKATMPLKVVVQRKGLAQPFTMQVNALVNPPAGQGHMGVEQKVTFVSVPLWQAPFKGIGQTLSTTRDFISQIGKMLIGAVQPQLVGPVGIVKITGQVAQAVPDLGWWPILSLTAMLSLNLAIVNILPFPALDGGRILLIFIELLRGGKRLKPEREGIINLIGMALLLTLMIVITVSDVIHWGS